MQRGRYFPVFLASSAKVLSNVLMSKAHLIGETLLICFGVGVIFVFLTEVKYLSFCLLLIVHPVEWHL